MFFIKIPQRSGYLNRSQGGFLYYGIVSLRCGILVLIKLKDMHEFITENIYLDHDITVHVAPKTEVRVFAKNMNDIHTYCDMPCRDDL